MQDEVYSRMIALVKMIAHDCDQCHRKNTSVCLSCYGNTARGISRDIDLCRENDDNESMMSMLVKIPDDTFITISRIANDNRIPYKKAYRIAGLLEKETLVEIRNGKWIKRLQSLQSDQSQDSLNQSEDTN